MDEYQKKMEQLKTREARTSWCVSVEQDLGCSTKEKEDGTHAGLHRVQRLENDILNLVSLCSISFTLQIRLPPQIVPAVLSQIYVVVGIIPANPRDPTARAASGFIVNDKIVSDALSAEGADLAELLSDLELGIR